MVKLPREWINDCINRGLPVQVAISYSNACYWPYLTTSGKVCTREHGYVEDIDHDTVIESRDLPIITMSSIERLQRYLIALQNG